MKGRLLSLKNPRDSVYSGGVLNGSPADRPKSRRWRRRIVVAILVACVLVVGAAMAVDYWTNGGRIYPGVEVAGINLGGETSEEARAILDERTGGLEEIELTGSERVTLSSDELGVDFDARASADQAYAVGRRGNILERARERIEATWGTVLLPLAVNYERERLRDGLSDVVAELTVEPVEAGFEVDGSEVLVTEGQTGRTVDEEELLDAIEGGLPEGRRGYELSVVTEEPELTTEEAMELRPTTLLGEYRTDYRETSDKSPERVDNLRIASGAIDGTLLAPGEVFSANDILAPLEYNETKVIIEGKEEKGDGGGLCQVSSTLYMAVNYAGLELVERHPHHSQLPYIRPGFDATVWFGGPASRPLDMKFRNDTEGYLLVREQVRDDGFVYAEVWGKPTGEEVEMDSESTYLGPDYSKWTTYKKVTENGEVVFDEVFHKDVYYPLVDEKGKTIRPDSEEAKPAPANP